MRTIISIGALASLILFFSSCKKDDNSSNSSGDAALVNGKSWTVSYYYDDKDETYKFTGYTFEFNDDGSLSVSHSSGSSNGTWSIGSSKFNINLGTTEPLDDLTDDWRIIEQSSDLIKLRDDNTTKTEEVHFSKI